MDAYQVLAMLRTYPTEGWEVSSVSPNIADMACTNPKCAVVRVALEDTYTHRVVITVDGASVLDVSDEDISRAYAGFRSDVVSKVGTRQEAEGHRQAVELEKAKGQL